MIDIFCVETETKNAERIIIDAGFLVYRPLSKCYNKHKYICKSVMRFCQKTLGFCAFARNAGEFYETPKYCRLL